MFFRWFLVAALLFAGPAQAQISLTGAGVGGASPSSVAPLLAFTALANGTLGGSPIAGSGTYTGTAPTSIFSATWTGCGGGSSTPAGFSAAAGTWSATFTVPGSAGSGCTLFITDNRSDTAPSPGVTISSSGITVDGQASQNAHTGGSTAVVTLSTTQTNDVIVVMGFYNGGGSTQPTFTVADTALLTWTQRAIQSTANAQNVEVEFWAPSTGALTSDVITITASQTNSYSSFTAFGVHGATSIAAPFDSNGSLPAKATTVTTPVSVSTTSAATLIFAGYRMSSTASPNFGAPFTNIPGSNTGAAFAVVGYNNYSSPQTSLSISLNVTDTQVGIGDAIH